jgi:AcrR family transcriptional regulator
LDRAVEYVCANGIGTLSLRPLAEALSVSPAVLLYHFTSKDQLIVEVLRRAGDRQRELFERLRSDEDLTAEEVCRRVWHLISDRRAERLFRLFFEVYGLALQDPSRFPGFFPGAIENWLSFLEKPALRSGLSAALARRHATVILAGYRGFLLDLCATRDRKRIDGAVEAWLASLECLPRTATRRAAPVRS